MYTDVDWHTLGDVPYRKFHLYDMDWQDKLNLSNNIVCGAPYAGPIAVIKDDRKALASGREQCSLAIYTSSGNKIAETDWNHKKIAGLGWSDREELAVILEDGNVFMYDILAKPVQNFLLLDLTTSASLLECRVWGNGVVAITADMQLYVAEGLAVLDGMTPPRKYRLKTGLSFERPYTSMAIVPPMLSRSGLLEVMLGTSDNSVVVIDENEVEDQLLQDRISAPITKMSVAPNGRFLACYRRDGVLTVMSTTFTTKVLDFDTKSVSRPLELTWCGEDAVVLLWRNTGIVMVGPYGDWLNFHYEGPVRLVSETDCCRIVTPTTCEILQRVPPTTESIRRIGSTEPAALLYDAMEAFEEGDPKSDENIRSIAATNQLVEAVQACVNAASAEFDISKQQAFMKAASYGKSFCSDMDPTEFVDVARKLRVLNEVRKPAVGFPLTMSQLNRMTTEVLVGKLTLRCHHFLALRICELLKLRNERVLVHWGCEKVAKLCRSSSAISDEEIKRIIKKQLEPYGKVSHLEIAAAAYQMGRRRLATMILDMVQNAADQVPLLLSMQEEELALQKAVNSEDNDLIYLTLLHLERSRTDTESFYRLVLSHPEAATLLKIYYKHKINPNDRSLLHNFLVFSRNFLEAGTAAAVQGGTHPSIDGRIQLLREAAQLFGQNRDLSFQKSATEDHADLLEIQKILDSRLRSRKGLFVQMSLNQTLDALIELSVESPEDAGRLEAEVTKLAKKFKVSDKAVCLIKIECYGRLGAWGHLARLGADKKCPVPPKNFALICLKYKQPASETEKYIDRITTAEDRFDLFMEIGSHRKAAEAAIKLKDGARLQEVAQQCRDAQLAAQIQDAMSKI